MTFIDEQVGYYNNENNISNNNNDNDNNQNQHNSNIRSPTITNVYLRIQLHLRDLYSGL